LTPGEEDTQTPHDDDEVYFVIRGDGYLKISDKNYAVSEGKAYYVQKGIPHKFFGNKKELVVLYFFSGPDS
jgi:mannose-6-phosphate isomerase-like protein (cupin superfamily)